MSFNFKIGDRVRYTGRYVNVFFKERIGHVGTVVGYSEVKFDIGRVWYGGISEHNLELVSTDPFELSIREYIASELRAF